RNNEPCSALHAVDTRGNPQRFHARADVRQESRADGLDEGLRGTTGQGVQLDLQNPRSGIAHAFQTGEPRVDLRVIPPRRHPVGAADSAEERLDLEWVFLPERDEV